MWPFSTHRRIRSITEGKIVGVKTPLSGMLQELTFDNGDLVIVPGRFENIIFKHDHVYVLIKFERDRMALYDKVVDDMPKEYYEHLGQPR